jgi:hypothetical protein
MKKCGWIVATVLKVSEKEIYFRVDESELFKESFKFVDIVGHVLTIPQKIKFWKSSLCKGRKYPVIFNRTEEEVVFIEKMEYVLLISQEDFVPIKLVGTGSKEDLYRLLGRVYTAVNLIYKVDIPLAEGFVKGTLVEIISKLKRNCPGDPEVYLTHEKTSWFILAPDGELKSTTMPLLPSMVKKQSS